MLLLAHLLVTPASTSQLDCFQSGQVAGKFGVLKKPQIGVFLIGVPNHPCWGFKTFALNNDLSSIFLSFPHISTFTEEFFICLYSSIILILVLILGSHLTWQKDTRRCRLKVSKVAPDSVAERTWQNSPITRDWSKVLPKELRLVFPKRAVFPEIETLVTTVLKSCRSVASNFGHGRNHIQMGFQLLTLNGQKVGELTETTFRLCGSVGDDVGQN